jgi:hypothetical protein
VASGASVSVLAPSSSLPQAATISPKLATIPSSARDRFDDLVIMTIPQFSV